MSAPFLTAVLAAALSYSAQRTAVGHGAVGAAHRMRCRAHASDSAASIDRMDTPATRKDASCVGDDTSVLYWPMTEHIFERMRSDLTGLRDLDLPADMVLARSAKPVAEMESWCFQSDRFRKIRCTHIDAGPKAQVLNSLWYPAPQYNLPVLGLDLLSFGPKKLCVVDLQPLPPHTAHHHELVQPLAAVREKYPLFLGEKSSKIYEDDLFFSPVMLFGRFRDEDEVKSTLFPALKEYVDFYINLANTCEPNHDPEAMASVLEGQRAYDQYNSERDPAIGLFRSYFGDAFSERYVFDFLFTSAVKTEHTGGAARTR